ncbi:MAG: Cna B-type domain-containing protein, partial [Clostridia bacterium]|nr:Cna B-type domain-containing protein [Clostridia bacterium]
MKKIFALLLAIVMALGISAAYAADNASQIGLYYKASTSNGSLAATPAVSAGMQSYESGLVQVKKTIAATGTENLFDVTLEVQTATKVTNSVEDAAVVILIDRSSSFTTSEFTALKKAVVAFIDSFKSTNTSVSRKIAIISFTGLTEIERNWIEIGKNKTANVTTVKNVVNSITVHSNGGTNFACALGEAKDLLQADTVSGIANKNVILVSDGQPTWHSTSVVHDGLDECDAGYGHTGNGSRCCHRAHYFTEQVMASGWSKIGRYALISGSNSTISCVGGTDCANCSGQTKCGSLGSITNWLKNDCGFVTYSATSASGLGTHFNTIYQKVTAVAEAQTVKFSMGGMIDYVSSGSSTNTTSFTASNDAITWSLISGENSYKATYRIRLDTLNASFAKDTFYPASGATTLTWRKKNGNGQVLVSGQKAYFNVPSVQGYAAQIKKVDAVTKDPLSGAEFTLQHSTSCGCGSKSTAWNNVTGVSGNDGLILFGSTTFVPSGHTYILTETKAPEGYILDGTAKNITVSYGLIDGKAIYELANVEKTSATVKKVWEDANDQDGKRPDSLTVMLSNGQSVTLNTDNNWEGTVNNLPKSTVSGQLIDYAWTEDEASLPEGYELTDTAKEGTITTLTNSYEPETTSATVKKVWKDAENQDGKRPAELKVTLSDGTEVTLNEANNWAATVNELPKYAAGVEIEYTWTEDEASL